jgi:hypothetical protein
MVASHEIGIRDADLSAASAFQSIRDSLRTVNLPTPEEALIPVGNSPRVAVLIVPYDANNGMLEDVCLRALENDPAMECVSSFIECINQSVEALPRNPSKARLHAFLSSREDPELRLGEAAQRGYMPWEALAFEQFRRFLTML